MNVYRVLLGACRTFLSVNRALVSVHTNLLIIYRVVLGVYGEILPSEEGVGAVTFDMQNETLKSQF